MKTEQISLKTVDDIIKYLQQFPGKTKVFISEWDCYNDEPSKREITYPFTVNTKSGKLKEIRL